MAESVILTGIFFCTVSGLFCSFCSHCIIVQLESSSSRELKT